MNPAVVLVVVFAVYASVQGDGMNESTIKAIADKCVASEKATPADIEALKRQSSDLNKEAKCVIGCMMMEFGLLSADGKLQKDMYMAQAEAMSNGDATTVKQATEMYEICARLTGGDICESAYKWSECMKKEMIARNIPFEL